MYLIGQCYKALSDIMTVMNYVVNITVISLFADNVFCLSVCKSVFTYAIKGNISYMFVLDPFYTYFHMFLFIFVCIFNVCLKSNYIRNTFNIHFKIPCFKIFPLIANLIYLSLSSEFLPFLAYFFHFFIQTCLF